MENAGNNKETLLARWLAGELTEEELARLRAKEGYAELEAIVAAMEDIAMPAFSEEESWERLRARLKEEATETQITAKENIPLPNNQESATPPTVVAHPATPPVRTIGRRQWLLAAAAALAFVVAALLWLNSSDSTPYQTMIATTTGEQKKVVLPDGSIALLNAHTTLGFTETDWPEQRKVYLEGEAFFIAKKGKTFTVKTDQGNVRVVGTRFNVYARERQLEVKCTEGAVQVINPTETEKVLVKAGEQVSVVNGRMQRRRGIDFTPRWFKGETVFRSVPRSRVFKELERQFGVIVVADSLEEKDFTGKFVNDDLQKALKMIRVPMGLEFEVKNDTVRFFVK